MTCSLEMAKINSPIFRKHLLNCQWICIVHPIFVGKSTLLLVALVENWHLQGVTVMCRMCWIFHGDHKIIDTSNNFTSIIMRCNRALRDSINHRHFSQFIEWIYRNDIVDPYQIYETGLEYSFNLLPTLV